MDYLYFTISLMGIRRLTEISKLPRHHDIVIMSRSKGTPQSFCKCRVVLDQFGHFRTRAFLFLRRRG
ncbi:hypothetical protein PAXRUDRAFT_683367 [Paxillus rubicundulus Ve08.2h10]|uniref:Unplaced genomic scaffold scaffold_7, whole genome shotgun sequence n=1 Tax=Paxillus rubicundulus Ve08.2h10 TaxID=930991 RepID=A0A0D0ED83_9AGAM|nr:hypothetical protein PAXRUDRAFT_683367 [Paxillus rubicundulus Ve08.2h10]